MEKAGDGWTADEGGVAVLGRDSFDEAYESDAVALRDGEFCGQEERTRSLFPGKYGKLYQNQNYAA